MSSINLHGGSGDVTRDGYCTPKWLAELIGRVDLDPCSNERSHVNAHIRWCGAGYTAEHGVGTCGLDMSPHVNAQFRTFINPPYSRGSVIQWVTAYCHTDFIFLLKWDPSTAWWRSLMRHTRYVWFPFERIEFEPPPGIKASSNPFPHALYLKSAPSDALRAAGLVMGAA